MNAGMQSTRSTRRRLSSSSRWTARFSTPTRISLRRSAIRSKRSKATITRCSSMPDYRQSPEYRLFWEKLGRGEYDAGQYKRIGKGGRDVWIQASYNPIFEQRQAFKVVKFATDITQQKLQQRRLRGPDRGHRQGAGRDRVHPRRQDRRRQRNFLKALGYTLDEIKGQHHAIFVEPGYRQSPEYRLFWEKLGRGEYDAGAIQAHRQRRQRDLDPGELQSDPGCRTASRSKSSNTPPISPPASRPAKLCSKRCSRCRRSSNRPRTTI